MPPRCEPGGPACRCHAGAKLVRALSHVSLGFPGLRGPGPAQGASARLTPEGPNGPAPAAVGPGARAFLEAHEAQAPLPEYPRAVGNTFGRLFRVTTWGESHGAAVGAVVDGCPPRLPLAEADIQPDLDRRVPGQSALVTQRKETDTVTILSGVFEGLTLGTPISLFIPNQDMRPGDYREVMEKYRPSHADYTYEAKYGVRDWRGGGRTSARETAGRVAAGAIARKLLAERFRVTVVAWVAKVGTLSVECDVEKVTREQVDATPIRCPELATAERMID